MFERITKYSVKNILRNKFLSLSSIMVLTLLMFFINILVILDDISYRLIDSINSKLTISLYLDEEYTKNSLEVSDFIWDISQIDEEIIVEYKTKEDILQDLRAKEPNLVKILERSNPLPDTIELSNISLNNYETVNNLVQSRMYLLANDETQEDYFANYSTQYQKIEDITSILDILKLWLNVIITIFVFSIAVIIYSVIWNFIFYYKDEIYITQLVGGSNIFIYWPFVMQWIIFSFLSFVLNFWLFHILLNSLNNNFWHIYLFDFSFWILMLELLLFMIIWGMSWFFSSKRYLR